MRQLYLHIGSHKTGTTALQLALKNNTPLLAAHDCAYVTSPKGAHLHYYIGPASPVAMFPDGFHVTDPQALRDALLDCPASTIIASSENFSFFVTPAAIADLHALLAPLFDKIHIVAYLRRQDRHAVSHHQEGAKPHRRAEAALWGNAPAALPQHAPQQDLYLDYDQRLGHWADAFGDTAMIIRVYDRANLIQGDIFTDFLSVMGLPVAAVQPTRNANVSLGLSQTKAGHLMNAAGLNGRLAETILKQLDDTGRLLPAKSEAAAFLARYVPGNRRLNQRFNVTTLPDLFPDDMTDYPDTATGWTAAQAEACTVQILSHVADVQPALLNLTADDLRLAAVALKDSQPASARRLIDAAFALRPSGVAIVKLRNQIGRKP